ncbi:MAG: rod-binding protein [bacterium]
MNINDNLILQKVHINNIQTKQKNNTFEAKNKRLKKTSEEFTSILLNQMFKAMRKTVPDGGFIKKGFAEEVFTDMMDNTMSEQGVQQSGFKALSNSLYEQLKRNSIEGQRPHPNRRFG